jgi:hypothetical protein
MKKKTKWKKFKPEQKGSGRGVSAKDAYYRRVGDTIEIKMTLDMEGLVIYENKY